jgi:large subunit ribosomal protein L25
MPPQKLELSAEPRTVLGKAVRQLRREGLVPANIFGHGASRAIQAPARAIEQLLNHGGRSAIVSIALDGGQPQTALVKGYQRDPRSGRLLHVDFQAVSLDERVTATVPLRFVGEPPAVRLFDAVLTHPVSELKVKALAKELPEAIEVDLSPLTELHAAIHVEDLKPPSGVELLDPAEEVIAVVLPPKVKEEIEAEAAAVSAEAEPAAAPVAAPPAPEERQEES